jgi:hypothetical protein
MVGRLERIVTAGSSLAGVSELVEKGGEET